MKTIKLRNDDRPMLVDAEDFERIDKFKWCYSCRRVRRVYRDGRKTINVPIANEVMNVMGVVFDHIDTDCFNNQKSNLRVCGVSKNNCNRKKQSKPSSSKYKGVDWRPEWNKWRAKIGKIYIGVFSDEEDAGRAYDTKAKELYGEFANLNFREDNQLID